MLELYRQLPFYMGSYFYPILTIPVLIAITKSIDIPIFFGIFFSGLLFISIFWDDRIRAFQTMKKTKTEVRLATHVLYEGKLCKIMNGFFTYKGSKYIISKEDNKEPSKLRAKTDKPYGFYKKGWEKEFYIKDELKKEFGKNVIQVDPPKYINQLFEQLVQPLFVFQVFSSILWILEGNIYYTIINMIMLFLYQMGLAFQRINMLSGFKTFGSHNINVSLVGVSGKGLQKEESVNSETLYPGDIIEIKNSTIVPCDLLLIEGMCNVNEAILSGESVPMLKQNILEKEDFQVFDYEKDKAHILYAGTKIVNIEKNSIRCFVLHTGYETNQGTLVKMMMTDEKVTSNNKETYLFMFMLFLSAIVAAVYNYMEGLKLNKTGHKLLLETVMILTDVVPIDLPFVLDMAVNSCIESLKKLNVYCLEPFRIPLAGKVDVCCFDKTGTLTETFTEVEKIEKLNDNTEIVLSACNGTIILGNAMTGDPLDISIYKFLEKVSDPETRKKFKELHKQITVFPFESEKKRMTVVSELNGKRFVTMKGAPEELKKYITNAPEDYDTIHQTYSKQGFRVIALGYKDINTMAKYPRETVEKSLKFAGFLLVGTKMKPEAKEVIKELTDSGHKIIMITGDNGGTGSYVMSQLGISNPICVEGEEIDVILNDYEAFKNVNVFARANPLQKENIIIKYNKKGFNTMMCGDGTNDVGALKKATVGIAMAEKANIVKKKNGGSEKINKNNPLAELMDPLTDHDIGEGGNNVAAPFTVRTGSLKSVLDIIRQGRSSLVTAIQMNKMMALNSLLNAFSLAFIDSLGVKNDDVQLIATGLLLAFSEIFLSNAQPLKKISKKRPVESIFNPYVIISLLLQVVVHIGSLLILVLRIKPTIPKVDITETEVESVFVPSLANSAIFLLSTFQHAVNIFTNYIGRPFRENLYENKKLSICLMGLMGMVLYFLFTNDPENLSAFKLVEMSSIRHFMAMIFLVNISLCFIIEKICFYIFMA